MSLHHSGAAWPEDKYLVAARRHPWLPLVSTKLECPVSKTRLSAFYSLDQGLSVLVRFVWQQSPLGKFVFYTSRQLLISLTSSPMVCCLHSTLNFATVLTSVVARVGTGGLLEVLFYRYLGYGITSYVRLVPIH
jgi:hypothetical protein